MALVGRLLLNRNSKLTQLFAIATCHQTGFNDILKELSTRRVMSNSEGEKSRRGKTAGIIIVGDEILKGHVVDANSFYLCKELYGLGVKVSKISVVADVIEQIADEVRDFSDRFDFVVTTGGIGPTHDDMTYAAVAKAFGQPIHINPDMAALLEKWLGHKGYSREVTMKMAEMPKNARLIFEPEKYLASFPIVNVENVYVFPGIPSYLRKMFPRLAPTLSSGNYFHTRQLFVARDEVSITPQLNQAVEKFKEDVVFGSYPIIDNLYFSTRFTMESHQENHVHAAAEFLTSILPDNSVVDFDNQPLATAAKKVYAIVEDKSHPLNEVVRIAVTKIEDAVEKYTMEKLCICFNGGKDCTALLHLFHAVVQKKLGGNANQKISALCIKNDNPFIQMEDFITESAQRYNLNLWRYDNTILSGLRSALTEHPEIKAVLMGTRRSDPSGQSLSYFQMTDPSWPQVMRVSPMLDWTYAQVWQFLRSLTLPYCSLYDRGFTSIGSQSNTVPNEALGYTDMNGEKLYRPAYTLEDSAAERTGRQ